MASSILNPAMTPANSTSVEVVEGGSKLLTLYTVNGEDIPYGVLFTLERLTINGHFEQAATFGMGSIVMSKDARSILISGVGTYRVVRPDISEYAVPVGVQEG